MKLPIFHYFNKKKPWQLFIGLLLEYLGRWVWCLGVTRWAGLVFKNMGARVELGFFRVDLAPESALVGLGLRSPQVGLDPMFMGAN